MLRVLLALLLALPFPAAAYSVLSHMANVDSTWDKCLLPTMRFRFPAATPDSILKTKAYAYGGAIIQDMGYYPFGSKLFTDLTHYVRSGQFVRNLLDEAQTPEEYAFALGALAHYSADTNGHPEGTNLATALIYPDLRQKFGKSVTYEEAPYQHTQVEFAFDVVQVAAGKYRSDDYHREIGFKVHKDVLERAFLKTYGLKLGQVVANVDLSIGSYRFVISQLIPTATRAAWQAKRSDLRKASPGLRRRDYVYKYNRRAYRREFGGSFQEPGTGARLLSYLIRILPKIGPLRPYAFKVPPEDAQKLFRQSFRSTMRDYCTRATQERQPRPAALPDTDFDTGRNTKAGEYALADETYGEWVRKLAADKFEAVTPAMQRNILAFFGPVPKPPKGEEQDSRKQEKTREALDELRALKLAE